MAIGSIAGATPGGASSKPTPKAGFAENSADGASNRYSFETPRPAGGHGRARHLWEAEPDVEVLCTRLNLDTAYRNHFYQELEDFVVHHHLNMQWYDKQIKHEERLRLTYFMFNLLLLAAIPLATFGLSYLDNEYGDGQGTTVEAITAVVTGLFGVQRALTAWLDKRQLAALYSKTRAKLKTAVYTFEQTWRHATLLDSDFTAFGAALEAATDAARAVVDEERDQHYEIEAAPTFSVEDMLSGATSSAKNLTSQLAAKETAAQAERREAEKAVREAEALIQQYQSLSAQKRDALNRTTDNDEKRRLIDEINENNSKVRSAELARALALAAFAADKG